MIVDIPADASNRRKRYLRQKNARTRGTHTDRQWQRIIEYCGFACVSCGKTKLNLEKDHIMPLYQGGCDCIHNIQPVCARCNASKGPDTTDHRPDGWKSYVVGGLS